MKRVMKMRGRRSGRAMISTAVFAVASGPAVTALATPPTQYVWSGNGGSGYFTNGANWVGGVPIPTSGNNLIVFGPRNDYGSAPFANGSYGVAGIYFNSSAAAVMVEDNPIAIGVSGIEDDASNAEAILNNLTLSSTQTWEIGNGSSARLTLSGTQNLSGNALTIQCNGSSTMTANLIGTGNVYTAGPGTLTLNGSSSFTGGLVVQGSGLVIPTGSSVTCSLFQTNTTGLNLAGGTINAQFSLGYLATGPVSGLISSGTISATEVDVGYAYAATINQIGGTVTSTNAFDIGGYYVGVAVAGTGTYNLGGGRLNAVLLNIGGVDAAGVLNETAGTVNVSSAAIGTAHNGTATVTGSGTTFNVSGAITIGSASATTTAVLNISSGAYSINAGQLSLNSSSATVILNQPQAFYIGSLSGVNGSSIQLTNVNGYSALELASSTSQSGAFHGTISGTGGITVNGSGVNEQLLGTNTYTGKTLVDQGNLELATGASANYEVDANTLTLDFSNLGTATVLAFGTGTVIYNTSSITGGILTGAGTHNLSSVTSFNGTNFASGATFNLNVSNLTLTNAFVAGTVIAGSGGSTVSVLGNFNLSGGTFNASGSHYLVVGGSPAASTTAVIASGTASYYLCEVGLYGQGLLVQTGGVQAGSQLYIGAGNSPSVFGTFNLSGGTVNQGGNGGVVVGYEGPGVLNQTGGTINSGSVIIGNFQSGYNGQASISGSAASWNLAGGGIQVGINSDPTTGQLTASNGASIVTTGALNLLSSAASVNISSATVTATRLTGAAGASLTLADPVGGTALTLDTSTTNTYSYAGNINGTGSILYNGSGTQVLSGANTFTGNVTVTSGTLNMTSGTATTYQASGGTLILGSGPLGTSTVRADGTGTVVFNTTSVTGGVLAGTSTFNVASVTSFSGTNFASGTTINTPSGKSLSITNGTNFGTATLNGTTTLYNWSSGGTVNINGPVSIATGNAFNQTGGTVTVAAASTVNLFGTGAINVTGGVLEDDGTLNGTVNVTNNAVFTGTGSFSLLLLGKPGVTNVGNYFPGGSATGQFTTMTNTSVIQPGTSATPVIVSGSVSFLTLENEIIVNSGQVLQISGALNASGNQVFFDGGGIAKLGSAIFGLIELDSGTLQLSSPGLLVTSNFNNGGTLDIASSAAVIQTTALSTITRYVQTGYNLSGGANWSGTGGITSSTAAADPSHLTAVGVIGNNQSGSPLYTAAHLFHNYAAGTNDTLVAYTYFGDANLSGKVDGSDYSLIDAGYASHGSKTGWYYGDFNYDGVIDGSDYALIDNAFNNQSTPINQTALVATATAQVAAVPEPGLLTLGALGSVALVRRRRSVWRN